MLKTFLTLTLTLMLTLASAQTQLFKPGESLPAGDYEVSRILDGDGFTIIVNGVERSVRLIGIDAPEKRGNEPFNKEATAFLTDLLVGQIVYITPGVQPTDRFGRALGYVSLDGKDVALQVAQVGLADSLTMEPNTRRADLYAAAVEGAKSTKKGMWRDLTGRFGNRNCNAFKTQAQAQAFFEGARPGDLHGLDRDNDGVACGRLSKR